MLLFARTRPLAMLLTLCFHLANHCLWILGEFPWVMLATNLIFLDALPSAVGASPPSPPPTMTTKVKAKRAPPPSTTPPAPAPVAVGWAQRAALLIGLLHALVQLLLPLRPLVVSWLDGGGLDPLDAVHTKAHTHLSRRMMAVSTRNFFNVSLRSEVCRRLALAPSWPLVADPCLRCPTLL